MDTKNNDDEQKASASSDGIEVPIKRVDPTESLEDRLTDNVIHGVGPARYFLKDENGEPVEDWGGVFRRVAENVAACEAKWGDEEDVELWTERFDTLLRQQEFVPNSPTLMNANTDIQQLSACFVLSPTDDMEHIFETAKQAAMIHKTGGGTGYAFHHLRPRGALVDSTGGTSSGPLSFMQVFDEVCNTVKQGGKRRGAQMAIMHVQHPDVGRFAVSKRVEGNFSNFNISLGITDEFKLAVEMDADYPLYDPEAGMTPGEGRQVFEVVPETAHFYDPKYEDCWNHERNTPGVDEKGDVVEENFWRDYVDDMQNPEAFEEYRDQISVRVGEELWLPAGFIWQLLVDGAHNNGEPGIFYLDETNREHSFDVEKHPDHYVHATNPCGEQPLENFESCNLGHINLSTVVDEKAPLWSEWTAENTISYRGDGGLEQAVEEFLDRALDHHTLERRAKWGTRLLDNVVEQSEFPLDDITDSVRNKRKIGLGLMGFHQMLIQLGMQYGSEESYEVGRQIMKLIDLHSTRASHELALERGTFPEWADSKWAQPTTYPEWFQKHGHAEPSEWARGYAMRNHNVTTVAPTGTTSMIGDTSGGIEPIYNVAYYKNVGSDIQGADMLVEFDDYFLRVLEANDIDPSAVKAEAEKKMAENEFDGVDSLDLVPTEIAELFVTAQDLTPEQHTRMQGAFQEYCDSGLSKTINLPNEATLDDIEEAFMLALDLKIKGATVYRDGSRDVQVNTTRAENNLDVESVLEDVDGEHLVDELRARVSGDKELREDLARLVQKAPTAERERMQADD